MSVIRGWLLKSYWKKKRRTFSIGRGSPTGIHVFLAFWKLHHQSHQQICHTKAEHKSTSPQCCMQTPMNGSQMILDLWLLVATALEPCTFVFQSYEPDQSLAMEFQAIYMEFLHPNNCLVRFIEKKIERLRLRSRISFECSSKILLS